MLLKDGRIGMFVVDKTGNIGYIKRLTMNMLTPKETIFVVEWSCDNCYNIHPRNVEQL